MGKVKDYFVSRLKNYVLVVGVKKAATAAVAVVASVVAAPTVASKLGALASWGVHVSFDPDMLEKAVVTGLVAAATFGVNLVKNWGKPK